MSLRISSALALATFALAGCGPQTPEPGGIEMECAIGPGAEFSQVCKVMEVKSLDEVAYLMLWHPDGGFRRVRYLSESQSVEVLDGADLALDIELLSDGGVQFSIGSDRYRLPARALEMTAP